MKAFEIKFKNGKTMTIKVEGIESIMQAYCLIYENDLAADKGGVEQIR